MDYLTIIILMLPTASYAVAELLKALKAGEKVRWLELVKTIAISAVTAGLITQSNADMLIQLAGTTVFSTLMDRIVNAILEYINKRPTK